MSEEKLESEGQRQAERTDKKTHWLVCQMRNKFENKRLVT